MKYLRMTWIIYGNSYQGISDKFKECIVHSILHSVFTNPAVLKTHSICNRDVCK